MGGMFGEPQKPTEFICLVLKMLQIQPDKDIIIEFIKNDDFKYLRLLGAFYLRLTGRAIDVFQYLEPLLNDYRRVRVRNPSGGFELTHIDEMVDQMLHSDYMFNIALPRLPMRITFEKVGQLDPRISVLQEEFDAAVLREQDDQAQEAAAKAAEASREQQAAAAANDDDREGRRRREKWELGRGDGRRSDRDGDRRRSRSRDRDREYRRERGRSRSRERYRDRDRDSRGYHRHSERSRSPGRHRDRDRDRDGARRRGRSGSRDGRGQERKRARGERQDGGADVGDSGGGAKDSLSVEATNQLRAQLGLPPLK